jgi:hypothetical protein
LRGWRLRRRASKARDPFVNDRVAWSPFLVIPAKAGIPLLPSTSRRYDTPMEERYIWSLLGIGAVTFAAWGILVVHSGHDLLFDDLRVVLASFGAAAVGSALRYLNRWRLKEIDDYPIWFSVVTGAKVAALGGVLILILLTLGAWLTGLFSPSFHFRALITVILSFAIVSFWSFLALQVQLLFRRPTPPAPPPAAPAPPPPPRRSRG